MAEKDTPPGGEGSTKGDQDRPPNENELMGPSGSETERQERAQPPEQESAGQAAPSGAEKHGEGASFPVVAVGASAGGLEALKEFFAACPADTPMAFLVATHMRPGQTSMMPELLAHETELPVLEAQEDARIEPGHVYVATPDGALGLSKGRLLRIETGDSQAGKLVIDLLFRSVAQECGERGACVILSGTGTDGTIGMRAVKETGGIAMAQEPESARFAGMPSSAIATGLVDYVLPPGEMPQRLTDYVNGLTVRRRSQDAGASLLPDEHLQRILKSLRSQTGHDFTSYKLSTVRRRVERRMNVHQITDAGDYVQYVRENPHEGEQLFRELLISVTGFFRDPEAFDALFPAVRDLIKKRSGQDQLRAWTPGCATGEETYSVAMVLHEAAEQADNPLEVQVFGTDINPEAIETARRGVYANGIKADISPERFSRWFVDEDGSCRVRKELRDMVVFAPQDVIKDPPFSNLDLIACRNVLIYMNPELQGKLLPLFHYALRPEGLLFLGSSESLGSSSALFSPVDARRKVFRKEEAPGYERPAIPTRKPEDSEETQNRGAAAAVQRARTTPSLEARIRDYLLRRFAPTSVVVNQAGDIVYIQGRTGRYLEPSEGEPKHNIAEMAREGLDTALIPVLRKANSDPGQAVNEQVRVKTNGDWIRVRLTAARMEAPEALRGLLLVTLEPVSGVKEQDPAGAALDAEPPSRVEELERELGYTKESLQTTIEELETTTEELQSSNEELQSANEELQSSNEELETSKEELQSLNEELTTVNAELNAKVEELSRANDDLHNLLNSTQIATIFLDTQLKVKRYTDEAQGFVRLIQSDIGRPLSDLVTNLRYPDLTRDCQEVLDTLVPKEEEVQTDGESWLLLRIMPYRTTENVIDGVVLTLVDINRIKEAEQATAVSEMARDYFQSIVETVRQPLLVLDAAYRVVSANSSFLGVFQRKGDEIEDESFFELGGGQWDTPELRRLLTGVLPANSMFKDCRVEGVFPGLGRKAFLVSGRKLERARSLPALILLAFEEVTPKEPA